MRALVAGKNPYPIKEKEPEEEETSFFESVKDFFNKEGGAVPSSLRDVGVTSIRKI